MKIKITNDASDILLEQRIEFDDFYIEQAYKGVYDIYLKSREYGFLGSISLGRFMSTSGPFCGDKIVLIKKDGETVKGRVKSVIGSGRNYTSSKVEIKSKKKKKKKSYFVDIDDVHEISFDYKTGEWSFDLSVPLGGNRVSL